MRATRVQINACSRARRHNARSRARVQRDDAAVCEPMWLFARAGNEPRRLLRWHIQATQHYDREHGQRDRRPERECPAAQRTRFARDSDLAPAQTRALFLEPCVGRRPELGSQLAR
jgi:hypothetical protein